MEFSKVQYVVDVVLSSYDRFIHNGHSRAMACTLTALKYGIERSKVVRLTNERDAGLIGNSGTTEFACIATTTAVVER